MTDTILENLRTCHLMVGLDSDTLSAIAAICSVEIFKRGDILFKGGDPADGMRIIRSGLVRISMSKGSGNTDERTLRYLGPGDVFGEVALIDGLDRTASVNAEEDTECVFLPRKHFIQLLEANTGLSVHLSYLLAERLRYSIEDIGDLSFLSVRQRLCRKLYELSFDHGTISNASTRFDRKFSQSELAKMIGASREATNRQLLALSRDGILTIDHGFLVIPDLERLLPDQGSDATNSKDLS